tara:strand:- start:206 stop:391 length:186 start_codon:yes stop_codon:yes gene_type:complete
MKTQNSLNDLSLREITALNGGSTVPTYDNSANYDAAVETGEAIVTFVAGFVSSFVKELFSL